jgi:adenylate kinase
MNKPFTAILLGPPGSGKSTQADFLVREMEAVHVDVGLALRKTSEMKTPLGEKISEIMNTRMGLVPDDIVEEVLSGALASISPEKSVIVDGAPRRVTQISIVEGVFETFERRADMAIYVALSEEESVRRISCRWMCPHCNRPFVSGVDFQKGEEICPLCGTPLTRRKDDTEEGVQKRYHVFATDTLPVVEYYRKKGTLLEVDGTQDPIAIFEDIRRALERV